MGSSLRLLSSIAIVLSIFWTGVVHAALKLGEAAPTFTLPDQKGVVHTLSDYRGKWLVLYFYPKDETPGCTTEACAFRNDIASIQVMGAVVVGISEDSIDSHEQFAKKYHLPFTLLADDHGKVAEAYGSLFSILGMMKYAKRHTFIINPQGHLAAMFLDVDPDDHSKQVIAKLKSLIANPAE